MGSCQPRQMLGSEQYRKESRAQHQEAWQRTGTVHFQQCRVGPLLETPWTLYLSGFSRGKEQINWPYMTTGFVVILYAVGWTGQRWLLSHRRSWGCGICSDHGVRCLSNPILVPKAWRILGEPWVFSPCWKVEEVEFLYQQWIAMDSSSRSGTTNQPAKQGPESGRRRQPCFPKASS